MLLVERDPRERGRGRARRGRGDARRRVADVRRDRRAARTGSRTRSRGMGVGRGDRVLWWGDTTLEAVPVFAALAKIGAVFAPLNARASLDEVDAGRRVRPAAAAARAARRTPTPAAELARAARRAVRRPTSPTRPASPTRPIRRSSVDERDPHVIFFTSGSTGRPKGVVLSHRTNWLRTFVGATTTPGRRRDRLHVPAVPHGGLDDRARRVAGAARRCTSCARPTPRRCCDDRRAAPRGAALLHPRGVGPHPRARRRRLRPLDARRKPTPARRRRRPSCSRAIKDALPHTVTRVFYGSTEAGPGARARRRRPVPQAGQRRRRATGRRGAARRARRGVRAQPVPHGRLLRRSRRDRRGAASTAGTTPATSARSTTRATSRSSAGRAT